MSSGREGYRGEGSEEEREAVTGLFSRESDDAGGHGHHVGALRAGEIDALVERLVTVERILALTKIRGNVACLYGAAIGPDLLVELLGKQCVLERRELRITRGNLGFEAMQQR